jgi:penicillin-binding protein-related factor A (putative recombinase)
MTLLKKAPTRYDNRGAWLEAALSSAFSTYERRGIGCGEKVPTPARILPDGMGRRCRSNVDFVGGIYGIALRIEAKLVHEPRLPLKNVEPHQVEKLETYERCGNLGVFIVCFDECETFMITPAWWRQAEWTNEDGYKRLIMAPSIPLRRFQAGGHGCRVVRHGVRGITLAIDEPILALWEERKRPSPLERAAMHNMTKEFIHA